jgi:hypothetical protein
MCSGLDLVLHRVFPAGEINGPGDGDEQREQGSLETRPVTTRPSTSDVHRDLIAVT